jgi:hypothetical protein
MRSLLRFASWRDGFSLLRLSKRVPTASLLVRKGRGLGDALLAFGVAHELSKEKRHVIISTRFAELAKNNPDIVAHIDPAAVDMLGMRLFPGRRVDLTYPENPGKHIGLEMCLRAGIKNPCAFSPKVYLTPAEAALGKAVASNHIAVQVDSDPQWTKNKQWPKERMGELIPELKNRAPVVIVGRRREGQFEHARDLRGALTLRQTAAVLQAARLFIGMEGGLMHLAKAVGCRSVIIYGGYIAPWQSGYESDVRLFTELPCSPCWRRKECPYNLTCLKTISVETVVRSVDGLLREQERAPGDSSGE